MTAVQLKTKRTSVILCRVFCIILVCVLAYNWQRIFYIECIDGMISDMPNHVKLAMGHNDYGLSSYLIRFLYGAFGEHRGQTLLSLCLAANNVVGLFTVWLLVRRLLPELDGSFAFLAVVLAALCGPWIIPGYQTEMYLGVYNGNVYHNMTVLFSRTFIPFVFLFFFDCWDKRHGRIAFLPWLGMALSFLIATLFKPNFAFAFIPMLAVMLLADFIKNRARYFMNDVILGLSVVPAGLACIWQYLVLFSGDFAGTSSGVALRVLLGTAGLSVIIMYLRSLLLPVYSLALQAPKENEAKHIWLIVICDAVAILEACILTETGFRANDGNFDWGSLALYPILFSISIALLMRLVQGTDWKDRGAAARAVLGIILLLGHIAVGVYCLYRARYGGYYWFYF